MDAEYVGTGSDQLKVMAVTRVAAYWAECGHCGKEMWSVTTSSYMVPADELTVTEPLSCLHCGAANYAGKALPRG